MTTDGPVLRPERGLTISALVGMASGVAVALGDIASLPMVIVVAAATSFVGSIVVFSVITYLDARSRGSTFGSALIRSLRTAGKVLAALMP